MLQTYTDRHRSADAFPIVDAERIYDYFYYLSKNGPINAYEFEENWISLEEIDFASKKRAQVLLHMAHAVSQVSDEKFQKELKQVVLENWNCWEERAYAAISKFNARDVADILKAHKMLRIKPSPNFLKPLMARFDIVSQNGNASATDYDYVFNAAAKLGFELSPRVQTDFLKRLEKAGSFLRNAKKTPLIWSCAVLDSMFPTGRYREIAELIRPHLPKSAHDICVEKQRYDSHLWFDWPLPNKNPNRQKGKISNGEKKLADFIFKLKVPVDGSHSAVIPQLPQAIDLTAHYRKTSIRIEVDGPTHFLDHAGETRRGLVGEYDGETRFRSALMHKLAPDERILRISSDIQEIITGHPDAPQTSFACRKSLVLAYLEKARAAQPGVNVAYITRQKDKPCEIGIRPI